MSKTAINLSYMVSNQDLDRKIQTKNMKIIEYSDLRFCNNILDMLPQPISILVILIETKPNTGHWTTLCRCNKVLTYFDSYGVKYDGEFINIPTNERILLHEDKFYLTALLNKTKKNGFKIEYNKMKLQSCSPNIHVVNG